MKYLLSIITFVSIALISSAQSSTAISKLFNDNRQPDGVSTETIIDGNALKGTDLSYYRSLVINDKPEMTDKLAAEVVKLGKNATSREVKYIDGKIYYAQFILEPSTHDNRNRYLFYLNSHLKGGKKVMIVFMSGKATPEQVKRLILTK